MIEEVNVKLKYHLSMALKNTSNLDCMLCQITAWVSEIILFCI